MVDDYRAFLERKSQIGKNSGFEPTFLPDTLFPFAKHLTEYAVRKGRCALFEGCGLTKTRQSLVWAQNVVEHTNKPILIATPIAVGHQFEKESQIVGLDAKVSRDGKFDTKIVVTNYERLGYFNANDFSGFVGDEAGRLKDSDSATKAYVKEFTRRMPYRLLCTATPAPNDYDELGNASEVLGELGYRDMQTMFFRQTQNGGKDAWGRTKYYLMEHAQKAFWRWICSWARACRKPSDIGFSDEGFILPKLTIRHEVVQRRTKQSGRLFEMPAYTLEEQRAERRETINERCERIAEIVSKRDCSVVWGHLNDECDLLEKLIPNCVQVSGKDSDDRKESKLIDFIEGRIPRLITKPSIAGWGLNLQHCNHTVAMVGHSYEAFHQLVHRFYRFGQKREVEVDVISTEGEERVLENLERKSKQADEMFDSLIENMNDSLRILNEETFHEQERLPAWL